MGNKAGGYVWFHRKITSWEWYKDTATCKLFFHLLITANFVDTRFMGKKIKRGQVVTSLNSLAEETGLSVQQVKTAIKHLISTNEITNVSTSQYRIITVVKYNEYQNPTIELTNDQQTTNKRLTNDQQHHNNDNNGNKGINNKERRGFTPPTLEEVKKFCEEKKLNVDAEKFYYHYQGVGWMVGKAKMKDWQATLMKWGLENGGSGNSGTGGTDEGSGKSKYDFLKSTVTYL
jgi:hypothetical protein